MKTEFNVWVIAISMYLSVSTIVVITIQCNHIVLGREASDWAFSVCRTSIMSLRFPLTIMYSSLCYFLRSRYWSFWHFLPNLHLLHLSHEITFTTFALQFADVTELDNATVSSVVLISIYLMTIRRQCPLCSEFCSLFCWMFDMGGHVFIHFAG